MEKIVSLDCSKSVSGNIPTNMLKKAKEIACPYVTDCINNSINDGIFPTELKKADVTSLFKSGEKTTKKNFRPISILPCVSKVYERLFGDQLNDHFINRNSLLCNLLSGFRKGYSTQHALQIVIENWKRSLDSKGIVGTILMDLSKAYDCLPHDLLIAKLEAYGIGRKSLKLIYSYLNGRKQRVKVASHYSSYKQTKIGVPQGSVLGPLLFNIFINDLFLINLQSDLCNFADDNTLYAFGHSFESVVSKLESDLEKILDWFFRNNMVANPGKFQLMFLGMKETVHLGLNINGQIIRASDQVKLLGVTIDKKLTFGQHVEDLCMKVSTKVKAFSRLLNYINFNQARVVFNAVILSHFNYCPLIWLFCSKAANSNINRVHKRALRVLYQDFESSFEELLFRHDDVTIHVKNLQKLLLEVYKTLHQLNPSYLWENFQTKSITYNLRKQVLCELPQRSHTIKYGINSLRFRGAMLWNTLNDDAKNVASVAAFKKEIKTWDGTSCLCTICK